MGEHTSVPHLVGDIEARFRDLETRFHESYWESQVKATPENGARRAELELELRRLKGDAGVFDAVNRALEEDIHDPVVKRQLDVLRRSLTGNQMDDAHRVAIVRLSSEIETEFASFRAAVAGHRLTENDIIEALRSSDDNDHREQVWRASKQVGGVVADRVRNLVRARNEVALSLGFADYYRMSLELQELPEAWLFDRLGELEQLTLGPYSTWKADVDERLRHRFGVQHVSPWHYADPFFQEAPPEGRVVLDEVFADVDAVAAAGRTFESLGIDLSRVIELSDLYPRDLKSQHAFCLDIDRSGKNVRILANIVSGERWTSTMLHESGHAVYDISFDQRLPYLLRRPTHTFVTEAIAILCGRFVRDPLWLRDVAGVDSEQVAAIERDLQHASAAESLQFVRWGLVMTHFERDLYADPEGDLDERWWDHVERFQLVDRPAVLPRGGWASKIHLAVAPVYYQNYLLGEMLASQLRRTIETECGGVARSETAGDFLTQRVFRAGALVRWDALVEEATGSALSAESFAADVLTTG
ncbi:MAG: M2 family metallopeptidase [Actinobacteria bacterium]|nr:M2 family metallopeptidase [Actinomycetota bacterium]